MGRLIGKLQLSFLLIFFLTINVFAGGTIAGKITIIKGKVFFERGGQKIQVKKDDTVLESDVIEAESGTARITMIDSNLVDVYPKSKLVISKYVYKPNKDEKEVELKVDFGKIKSTVIQKYDGAKNKFQIKTPSAVAGVRGTVFTAEYDKLKKISKVVTIEGLVAVAKIAEGDRPSAPVFVRPNQVVKVDIEQSKAEQPRDLTSEERESRQKEDKDLGYQYDPKNDPPPPPPPSGANNPPPQQPPPGDGPPPQGGPATGGLPPMGNPAGQPGSQAGGNNNNNNNNQPNQPPMGQPATQPGLPNQPPPVAAGDISQPPATTQGDNAPPGTANRGGGSSSGQTDRVAAPQPKSANREVPMPKEPVREIKESARQIKEPVREVKEPVRQIKESVTNAVNNTAARQQVQQQAQERRQKELEGEQSKKQKQLEDEQARKQKQLEEEMKKRQQAEQQRAENARRLAEEAAKRAATLPPPIGLPSGGGTTAPSPGTNLPGY